MERLLRSLRRRMNASASPQASNSADEPSAIGAKPTADQIEALRDLNATYLHPIQCAQKLYSKNIRQRKNIVSVLKQREFGLVDFHRCASARHQTLDRYFRCEVVATMRSPTFCGQFSEDGQRFFSACQDQFIRLYDTTIYSSFQKLAEILVEDVGWSILDTALSPDRTSVAYSTWSENIYLIKLHETGGPPKVNPLYLNPRTPSFSIFSLQFSGDGSEIIGGSNDAHVYIYDLQKNRRTLRVNAHDGDINAVRFIDNSNSLIVSGSDDNLVSVWDRRALNESQPKPVGIFAGHTNGITFVHSRMDTRYLISNSKDQSIKLWDMRRFAKETTVDKIRSLSNDDYYEWDYRYEPLKRRHQTFDIGGDPSVRTYRGHSVAYTLIRCYFSPSFTTGQKYIITGSADGSIRIYDVLTGEIKLCLQESITMNSQREQCVRDVSWHPYENCIISTSWNRHRSHVRWSYSSEQPIENQSNAINDSKIVTLDKLAASVRRPSTRSSTRLLRQFLNYPSDSNSDDEEYFVDN